MLYNLFFSSMSPYTYMSKQKENFQSCNLSSWERVIVNGLLEISQFHFYRYQRLSYEHFYEKT
jgi:hypothetical protein